MHRLQELLRMGRTTEWHYRKAFARGGVLEGPSDDLPAAEGG